MTDRLGPEIERLFEVGAPPLTLGELGQVRTSPRSPAALRPVLAGIAVVVLAVGVTFWISRLQPGPAEPNVVCLEPPADQLAVESGVGITLVPNPIVSGGTGNLTVMATTGLYAEWQCWDGSRWVPTHYLTRGGGPVEHDEVGYIPAVGFLPGAVAVTIPRVPAGTYRIHDTTADQEDAFLIVRVLEIGPPTTIRPEAENVSFDPGPLQLRFGHSVVWTGQEMIVWGGAADEESQDRLADGAAFDPSTNTWRTIATAPLEPRFDHHAIWTGSEMLILGGAGRRDGAAYDPSTDSWRPIADSPFPPAPPSNMPGLGRSAAIWASDRFFVWETLTDRMAVYYLATDSWEVLPGVGAEVVGGRLRWTGQELIALWNTPASVGIGPLRGARLRNGEWVPMATPPDTTAPSARSSFWDGTRLMLAGHSVSLSYDLGSDSWSGREAAPFEGCVSYMSEPLNLAGRGSLVLCDETSLFYDYEAGFWAVVAVQGEAEPRFAAWTGTELLVWGPCCYESAESFTLHAWRWTPPE